MAIVHPLMTCHARPCKLLKTSKPIRAGHRCFASSSEASAAKSIEETGIPLMDAKHLLLCVVDSSEYLSSASKEALGAACRIVKGREGSRLTVYASSVGAGERFIENVRWHLADQGVENYLLHEDETQPTCVAASLGDVADEVSADLVILASAAVHSKFVDANLLAEFVPCPLVLMP